MTPSQNLHIDNLMPESFLQAVRSTFSGSHVSAALIELGEITANQSRSDGYLKLLSKAELDRYSTFSFIKRKTEYLAGRISAKLAISMFMASKNLLQLKDLHIDNNQSGRPHVILPSSCNSLTAPDISISHSKRFGCSIAADTYCGVDIQEPQDTLLRVYDKFCHTKEEHLLSNSGKISSTIEQLTLLWAAKEAVRKACSHSFIPGFLELSLLSIEIHSGFYTLIFSHRAGNSTVACRFIHGYGMAISLSKEKCNA